MFFVCRNSYIAKFCAGRNAYCFSLIELMLTISIIAILASLIAPSLNNARKRAYQIQCASNLRQVATGTMLYRTDNGAYPAPERFVEDFTPLYPYLKTLKVFVCQGSPYSRREIRTAADLVGKTDYLYSFLTDMDLQDIEKNQKDDSGGKKNGNGSSKPNGGNNGMGNNVGPYKIDPSNPKFKRVWAEKIKVPVIYDRKGPAHFSTINICYVQDGRVENRSDMCNLWVLNAKGELLLDSVTPFPSE